MSDYIKREDAIESVRDVRVNNSEYGETEGLMEAEDILEYVPSVDVVEVVRCKDCKWWTKQEDSLQGKCSLMQSYPTGMWFCANGEKK